MAVALPKNTGSGDVKRAAHAYMNKLLDRDTEAMAASQLDSMARSLPTHSLPSFLSAISDTRPSDKTPLRRHCVRLLSLLSLSHPPHSLAPLLPRMLSAVVRRLRDPDSSVRCACVDAVRSMVTTSAATTPSITFIRPLSETLLLEQDYHAQMGSAMCLAAAIEGFGTPDPDRSIHLHRLLPRLVKLARSDAFKAKPALLGLMGAVAAGGGAWTPTSMGTLMPCLVEFLGSEDWAARKAAAEALCRVASACDARLLVAFKSRCLASCEACKFDKVKTVRESMSQMLEAWKVLPDSVMEEGGDDGVAHGGGCINEINGDGHVTKGCKNSNFVKSNSQLSVTKNRYPTSRSPPREPSPAPLVQRNRTPSSERRSSPPLFRKLDRNKNDSDWGTETAIQQSNSSKTVHEDKQHKSECNARFLAGINRSLFENSFKDEVKSDYSKAGTNVVSSHEKESFGSFAGSLLDEVSKHEMESVDLCLIRRQLVLIENQQSGLIDLLQKFIGSSQNGMHALEKRVHSLEMALDEISHEISIPGGRMTNANLSAKRCCRLPGTEFLSSKFWRRTEGKYSSRFSDSSSSALTGIRSSADKTSTDSFNWDKQQYGIQSGILVNPLTVVNSCSRDSSDVGSERMLKKAGYIPGYALSREGKGFDGASTSTCSSVPGILNRST